MSLTAPTKGGDGKPFEVPPAGNWRAIVSAIIDLGTHYEKFVARKEGDKDNEGWKHKVYIVFQLSKKKTDGSPHYIGQQYTLSLVEKATLRKVYLAIMGNVPSGENADITVMLGKPCAVQVSNTPPNKDGKVYANIQSVGSYPADDETPPPPKPVEPPLLYLLASGQPFQEPTWMPRIYGQKVADVIALSREKSGGNNQGPPSQSGHQQPAAAGGTARF